MDANLVKWMDERLETARKELKAFEARMKAESEATKKEFEKMNGYIKRESDGVEKEATMAVKSHLLNTKQGYKLYIPNGFPKVLRRPEDNSLLTDLDGVFILTKNPEVGDYNDELISFDDSLPPEAAEFGKMMRDYAKQLPKLSQNPLAIDSIFVIIETKHHITEDRVITKIEQLDHIERYIRAAKECQSNPNTPNYTNKFKKNANMFNIHKYEPQVLLYLGGPLWDSKAKTKLEQYFNERPNLKQQIGILTVNGSRYSVGDFSNSFRAGGRKKRSSLHVPVKQQS